MVPGYTPAFLTLSSTFYFAEADRARILELCYFKPSDKIGGLPAGLCPWVVNHRKVNMAYKDEVQLGHEC